MMFIRDDVNEYDEIVPQPTLSITYYYRYGSLLSMRIEKLVHLKMRFVV